ncbi:TetR/AcrR family transcriptional regulator [Nesterenkonia alkaliphila]|nr:helix-turn-helix domain-containing protein [Nesterenkonia alkaliphila]GFZ96941.1 TetR family transcriptional regulator [Nesterenkonia alkaliphila]
MNRQALIEAAREEFISEGAQVPLSRIAKRARVGQGTLYRHFADRADLATAVFEQNLHQVEEAVSASATPYRTFFDLLTAQVSEASVIIELVAGEDSTPQAGRLRGQVGRLVRQVHEAARTSGELKEEVETRDLQAAVSMLCLPLAKAQAVQREEEAYRIRRILDAWFLRG